jgi:hypothetical protein
MIGRACNVNIKIPLCGATKKMHLPVNNNFYLEFCGECP